MPERGGMDARPRVGGTGGGGRRRTELKRGGGLRRPPDRSASRSSSHLKVRAFAPPVGQGGAEEEGGLRRLDLRVRWCGSPQLAGDCARDRRVDGVGTRAGRWIASVKKNSKDGRNHFASANFFGLPPSCQTYRTDTIKKKLTELTDGPSVRGKVRLVLMTKKF